MEDNDEKQILRTDLPVASATSVESPQLFQIVHGLYSPRCYIAIATRGKHGMIAVRKFADDSYKLKFYPSFEFWGFSQELLESLGAFSGTFLSRPEQYERAMFDENGLKKVLEKVNEEEMAQSRAEKSQPETKLQSVSIAPLNEAFKQLE